MNKILNFNYESSLTDLCEINSSFDKGILRICYTGENRNFTFISKEAIERNIKTIYNCPIVCNYNREDGTIGGHDIDISLVENEDGAEFEIVNLTQPIGVIPESAKVWFENYEETDGTIHEYLYAEVLLWKRQEAYKKIKKDGITKHSMEITVKDGRIVDGMLHIENFEFTAFALIGIEPCFESSALEMFSSNIFRDEYLIMMNEVKNTFLANTSDENIEENDKEGGRKILENMFKEDIEEIKEEEELEEKEDITEDIVLEDEVITEDDETSEESDEEKKESDFTDSESEIEVLKQQLLEAQEAITKLEEEIKELKEYKENTEIAIAEEAREEILDEFIDLNDKDEFIALRNNASKLDLEALREKCFAIRGKYAYSNIGKASHDGRTPKLPIDFGISKSEKELPYNGIVEKYANR